MAIANYQTIERSSAYRDLVSKRSKLGWTLSAVMLVIYFGFILLVAYAPKFLGMPLGAGVMTVGIPVGLAVIVSAFVLTGLYVRRANTEFDALTRQIVEESQVMTPRAALLAGAAGLLAPCCRRAAVRGGRGRGRRPSRRPTGPPSSMFFAFVAVDARHHLLGGAADQIGRAVLLRRRRHHRLPERPRDRRRLHVGGVVPRYFRPGLRVGL